MTNSEIERRIYSVSRLTRKIKDLLESNFPLVWVSGEISNFRPAASGHFYFTIKDHISQISAVMFRGQNRQLRFDLENGLDVIGFGRLAVYEPRGTYQLIFEYLEPKGAGAHHIAFEKLKKQLADEGLFDERHKQVLPLLPRKICLITSPKGAVVHDFIHVSRRRFPNIDIDIIPIQVQGYEAESGIVAALDLANRRKDADNIIIARGGGSAEDLAAFNSESVARSIFLSEIPVISAVGHETDFTISDFVADMRAPTPSAAAEIAVPEKMKLAENHTRHLVTLSRELKNICNNLRNRLDLASSRLLDPTAQIQHHRMRIDDLFTRMEQAVGRLIFTRKEKYLWIANNLSSIRTKNYIDKYKQLLEKETISLINTTENSLKRYRNKLETISVRLTSVDPYTVLSRGYSITRKADDLNVITDPGHVTPGELLEILVAKGNFFVNVNKEGSRLKAKRFKGEKSSEH
jgi:exodeoxyribonuclease VII large subunit